MPGGGAKKRLGQHFLVAPEYIDRIIAALAPQTTDTVVEIGPGQGALTLPLLQRLHRLTAIELDRDLIPRLQAAAEQHGDLQLLSEDALKVDFTALAAGQRLRLIGNLPYYISSPLLFHCLEHAGVIADMLFMLQKEVVDRMAAAPGSKTYGRLSVMLQLACRVEPLFEVPAGAFNPPPKVTSAVVRLRPRPEAETPSPQAWQAITQVVRAAFGQRRKTLANALKSLLNADAITAAGIDPGTRAEMLPPAAFVRLAQARAAGSRLA